MESSNPKNIANRQDSEERYRTLFKSIDQGFCIVEVLFDEGDNPVDYRFLETNPAFEKQTGLIHAEGKRMLELAPAHERHWFETYGRIALTGNAERFENEAKQLKRWYDVYAFRIDEPELRRVAILFNDISLRKQSERALIRAEKLAVTGRMASAIAHEINNPLAAALNALYLASHDKGMSEESRQFIAMATRELQRVAEIAKQTLGFYRDNSAAGIVNVREIADSVVALHSRKLNDKNIEVDRRYLSDVPVLGVGGEVRQIISNLFSNSIDAVGQQGRIHLRIAGPALFGGDRATVRLTVADDGTGIERQHLEDIFEPFFSTKASAGTGLGLWVTRELVKKHDGRLRVRSKSGSGSVFQVYLPVARQEVRRELDENLSATG